MVIFVQIKGCGCNYYVGGKNVMVETVEYYRIFWWYTFMSIQATFKGWMEIMYAAVDSRSKVITF